MLTFCLKTINFNFSENYNKTSVTIQKTTKFKTY